MQAAIAQHLNVSESAILKIEEWKNVLFAVVRGLGGRFISKKVTQTMQTELESGYELADKIADAIEDSDTIYSASLWNKKAGETRIYVSYSSKKGKKDCGYIRVMDSGEIYRHLTLQAGTIEALYEDLKSLKVKQAPVKLTSSDPLTQIVEECWECGATYTSYGNVESGNMCCRRCR